MNTIIHTPTPNLNDSLDFYSRLGYQRIPDDNLTLVSDGQCLIEINPDRFARAGIKMFKESWKEEVERLEKTAAVISSEKGYLLSDPSGVWIYLVKGLPEITADLSGLSPSLLGNFAGMSLETGDINRSAGIWETLGFAQSMGSLEQGWIAYQNPDGFTVSFMGPNACPHLFFNPSLTFFNGKNNPAIIRNIREAGIPITEEITHFNQEGIVDNIIIRDPGGYGFFIFND